MISLWHVLLSLLFVLMTWLFNKVKSIYNRLNKKNIKVPDVEVLKKIVPLSKEDGWKVSVVNNGVPVWKYQTNFTFAPTNIYGCRALLQGKPEEILNALLDVKTFCSLFPNLSPLKLESKENSGGNGDVLSISNINTSLSLTSIITSHHSIFTLERCWFKDGSSAWMYMYPTSSLLSNEYGYWIAFFMHELSYKDTCLLHIFSSYPESTGISYVSQMLSSCLILIRENMDSMHLLKSKKRNDENARNDIKSNPSKGSLQAKTKSQKTPENIIGQEAVGQVEAPAVINHIPTPTESQQDVMKFKTKKEVEKVKDDRTKSQFVPEDLKSKFLYDDELLPYRDLLEESYKILWKAFIADENTPGWHDGGIKDGVHLYGKNGDEESASGMNKGVITVNVPLPYLLYYTHNLELRKEFDAIFESGIEFKVFNDGITKFNNLLFQNIWPTTGRDFCSISALRHLKGNIYASAVRKMVHPDCPERKNKVRGEILIGGYVFEELCKDPPAIRLTFITRVDLKGSIPQRIINRVSAEQPLMVGIIKRHVERRYKNRDPDVDGLDILEKIYAVPSILEERPTENEQAAPSEDLSTPANNSQEIKRDVTENVGNVSIDTMPCTPGTSTPVPQERVTDEKYILGNGFSMRDQQYKKCTEDETEMRLPKRMNSEDSLMTDSMSISGLSQFTDDQTQVSISDQPLDLPRDASGKIDYITLANQAAAALEEEFIMARPMTSESSLNNDTSEGSGNWVYQGTTKNVEILRKISPGQKFHSFLGRGVINALPVTVWEAVKNPTTRFIFDNMLKKNIVLKELTDRHRILYLRHETTACFVKQARDFCILMSERIEQERCLLVGTSVEIPECPPVRDCVRGRILSSGWIVEPMLYQGRHCSKVTYITQVDFGGRFPSRLINFIAKRQPLSIAYLRDYLQTVEF